MSREVVDNIFGVLTQWPDGAWELLYDSKAFNAKLIVHIEAENFEGSEHPSERQYHAFQWFKDNQYNVKHLVESSIYSYYMEHLPSFRKAWGKEADERAPALNEADQIWSLLEGTPKVCLLSEGGDISIWFNVKWDPEHGVCVLIEDGDVVLVE